MPIRKTHALNERKPGGTWTASKPEPMATKKATPKKAPAKTTEPKDLLVRDLVTDKSLALFQRLQKQYGVNNNAKAIRYHFDRLQAERDKAAKDSSTVDALTDAMERVRHARSLVDQYTKELDRAMADLLALGGQLRKNPRQFRIDV